MSYGGELGAVTGLRCSAAAAAADTARANPALAGTGSTTGTTTTPSWWWPSSGGRRRRRCAVRCLSVSRTKTNAHATDTARSIGGAGGVWPVYRVPTSSCGRRQCDSGRRWQCRRRVLVGRARDDFRINDNNRNAQKTTTTTTENGHRRASPCAITGRCAAAAAAGGPCKARRCERTLPEMSIIVAAGLRSASVGGA